MRLGAAVVEEHLALFGALAGHRDHPPVEVHVADVEAAQLGHPQPAAVEQLEHGVVPAIDLGRGPGNGVGRRLQQLVQLGVAEDPGQAGVGSRRRQAGRRVGVDQAPLRAPLEVRPERGRRPGDGGPRVPAGGQEGEIPAQEDPVDVTGALGPAPAGPLGEPLGVRRVRPHRGRRQTAHRPPERFDLPGHVQNSTCPGLTDRAPPAPAVVV